MTLWPCAAELVNYALGVVAFGNILDMRRFDFVAELLLEGEQALMVLIAPAMVADRTDVDEADFGLALRLHSIGRQSKRCGSGEAQAQQAQNSFHVIDPFSRRCIR